MQKKTLIAKLSVDVSLLSVAQIKACKAQMAKAFECGGIQAEFEVATEEVGDSTFLTELMEKMSAMLVGEATDTASDKQPMDVMELDESQSNVLRGFFDHPGS